MPNGDVQFLNNCRKENPTSFSTKLKVKLADIERESLQSAGITIEKMNYVTSSLQYIGSEGQKFFTEYFASISNDKAIDDNVFSSINKLKKYK